jgi:hypothetical protein
VALSLPIRRDSPPASKTALMFMLSSYIVIPSEARNLTQADGSRRL